ncbi:unnamed protein product [Pelagomonas calceolata]|uniref:Uncharacterized protein n=1 Tax=Pelagomonas calceolata TaxID=35677 RepID=A0A8J2S8N8_9STRA|nr:unnamed protein product [Pelagomonas calceolata]
MFSDDKRGGTAPTPTPTHQGLFAHDESTRPRTHDTSASDLVDLNLALRAQFHRKKESSFVQPHISEAFDEWAAFKPVDEGRGSPSKAFDEPRDLRRKPSGTRKKTPKSAPKYRTERRTSPDRRASVKPRSATARSFVAHGNKGLSSTPVKRSTSARPGFSQPKQRESQATRAWRSKSARGERTKQAEQAYRPRVAKQPKSASSVRRKPPVVQTDRPRLTLRTRRDVADWERGVLRAPQSPVKDLKDDPYPTRSLVKRSISRRGVPEPQRSWNEAALGTRAEARKQRPPSRQKGAYPTHLETESTETDSPPPSPVKRPATASRQRRDEQPTRPPSRQKLPKRALVLDGVSGPPSPKKTNAWSDKAPTPTLYSDESDDAPTSPSKRQPNSEDRHHDPEADGFTAIDGPRTPCPFKIQVQHGCEDAVELDDLGLSRNYDSGARSPTSRPQSARHRSPKASWTQPPRQSFMQPRRVVRSGSSPEMVAALLERTVIEEVNDAELQSISDDEDILEVASGTTDDDDDPHLETNLGEEFLSLFAGTPAG